MATKKRPIKKAKKQATRGKTTAKTKNVSSTGARSSARGTARSTDAGDDQVARIQRVIDMMVQNGAVEVELEEAGKRLRVRLKEELPAQTIVAHQSAISPAAVVLPSAPPPASTSVAGAEELEAATEGEVFVSPMVGTFYRAPAPEAESFVEVGERVTPDTTLCVIEAMKVMNEIKAEMEGQITAILVENGEPVEFGQPLFRVTA